MWEEENFHLERSLRAGEAIEKTVAPRRKNDFEGWGGDDAAYDDFARG